MLLQDRAQNQAARWTKQGCLSSMSWQNKLSSPELHQPQLVCSSRGSYQSHRYQATYIILRLLQQLETSASNQYHCNHGSSFDCEQSRSGSDCNQPHTHDRAITTDSYFTRSRHRIQTPEIELGEGQSWDGKAYPLFVFYNTNLIVTAESRTCPLPPPQARTRRAEH